MKTLLKMAWLNIWRNKRRTLILLCAMAAGLIGVLFTMGFMQGWMNQMVDNAIMTYEGHVKILGKGFQRNPVIENSMPAMPDVEGILNRDPRVRAWTERLTAQGLLSTPTDSRVVTIVGADPDREPQVSVIGEALRDGEFVSSKEPLKIAIGRTLSEKIKKGLGKKVVLMSQRLDGEIGSAAFRVGGLFDTGSGSYDESTVYISLADARQMLAEGDRVTEITILLHDIKDSEVVAADLARELKERGVEVVTWKDRLPFIVEMIKLSDRFAIPYYALFYIAMAFGIVNTLLMAIGERTHEIGIMLAMGMHRRTLVLLIMLESLFLAILAALAGAGIGWGLVAWFGHRGIDLSAFSAAMEYYGLGHVLYPVLDPGRAAWAVVAMLAVALVFSFYPAARAARLVPVEAIRRAG
ncbi:MAG: FtsX-like permease family protein [Verrucomicrobia bacterium]|nr:FtsX-like permease family protein [Verrucomicrobiota bacterium]